MGIDFTVAGPRLANLARQWGVKFIHMDTSGVGEGLADILRAEGVSIVPFTFSHESKARLIGRFASEMERGRIHFLRDDDVLRRRIFMNDDAVGGIAGHINYEVPVRMHRAYMHIEKKRARVAVEYRILHAESFSEAFNDICAQFRFAF